MSYYLLIRGPLGSGKTTVSQRVAQKVGGEHISIDQILDDHGFWNSGRLAEFLQANVVAAEQARVLLVRDIPVIIDGNFYWKSQIADLIRRLPFPHFIFTLDAPLAVCIERDRRRKPPHGREATEQVFAKTTRFHAGVRINANRPLEPVVSDVVQRLRRGRPRSSPTRGRRLSRR